MWSKEEAKELKINFWNGFKRYCSKHKIYRKWVLTGVKIKSTQLKFYADEQKALVLQRIAGRICIGTKITSAWANAR